MASSTKRRTAKLETTKSIIQLPAIAELVIPDHFRCPISLDLMKDPVTSPTGITYDRRSIERWLDMGNPTCPITNMELTVEGLIPNHSIRRMIQNWCVANESYGIERIPTPRIPVSSAEASEILSNIYMATQSRDSDRCFELVGRLKSLEKESERNRRCFVSNGAPTVLASAFRMSVSESLRVLTEILEALVSLLPFDDEVVVLELGSTSESIDSIVRIMKYGDDESKLNAVLMVKKMAALATTKAIADNNGLVEALLEFIRDPVSTQATKASLVATFYLIIDNNMIATEFVKMGLIPLILEILIDSNKSMIEKALAILDGLCGCDLGREKACANALTIPVLAKKMFRVSEMATELTVSALWKLCKNCKGECLVECLQVGLFQKLLLLLQVGCGESPKEKATEMLKMMSGCSEKLECIDTANFKGLNRPSL